MSRRKLPPLILPVLSLAAAALLPLVAVPLVANAAAFVAKNRAQQAIDAITELDLSKAEKLFKDLGQKSPALAMERARLSLYKGDCDTAEAILSSPSLHESEDGAQLYAVAKGCARATAGAPIVEDKQKGVWIRLQDHRDRALAPYIADVADRTRTALARDLGVDLPRPLRIDLVRDLFSLAAVSGLPVEAAETTGTVAVARWGRVIMITPRATEKGYPWQDTLAHELCHLVISRASRDRAPLWLQEGIAKRQETRWRAPRPGDGTPDPDQVAYRAKVTNRSVGIDRLGPSIAMLPTPEAASIAYAEVFSFMNYWIRENGADALKLLFIDLREAPAKQPDRVMTSVTGYSLSDWNRRWQADLQDRLSKGGPKTAPGQVDPLAHHEMPILDPQAYSRWLRLGELLLSHGFASAAETRFQKALAQAPKSPAARHLLARSKLLSPSDAPASSRTEAEAALGKADELTIVHGAWFALHGRFLKEAGHAEAAQSAFDLAVGVDPLLDEVACEGHGKMGRPEDKKVALPQDPKKRRLCEAALAVPRDGPPASD